MAAGNQGYTPQQSWQAFYNGLNDSSNPPGVAQSSLPYSSDDKYDTPSGHQ